MSGGRSYNGRAVESRISVVAVVPAKASRPGVHLASTHIRLLRRFEHPIVRRFVAATVLDQGSPSTMPKPTSSSSSERHLRRRTSSPSSNACVGAAFP
jgi:hypothetical protein